PTITAGAVQGSDTGNFSETYNTKNAGSGKTLTPSGTVSDGNSGNNYSYTFVTNTTGVITAKSLTATITADGKTYDRTTAAVAHQTGTASSRQSGYTANFVETYNNKNDGS